MSGADTALCYRRMAVQQASSAGLMVILYDMLVDDLRRAIVALQNGVVEARCGHVKHAFTIIELLEGSLDHEHNESAVWSLTRFYALLRKELLTAQFGSNDRLLEQQIALILDVRQAWQQADAEARAQSRNDDASVTSPSVNRSTETSQWFA